MKKTFLFLAAAFFAILNFSCSGGDDNPILIVGPWTTEEPVVTPTDSSGGTQTTPGTTEPATQQPAEWNVTYVITNGSDDMASESRTSGKFTAQSELTIPQKEGFQFKGWYLDQAQTQTVASFANMTGDVVLYGHWAGKLYTVVIEGIDGAALAEGSVAVTGFSTEDQSLALPAYTKRFYNFDGLYLDSGYSGTAVTQIDKSAAAAGATLTLYAKWTLIEYNVTYIITNGSANMSVELRTGGKYSGESELTLPQKEGFQFKGWYLDAEQKQPVASFADLTGDLILYGHWAGKLYDVQIVGTDGSALAQGSIPVTGFSTEDQILALPSYTKRFYSFDGLYLDSEFNGTAVTQIDRSSAAAGSTLTLYAKWTLMEYNVTYIITNGSGDMTGESRTSGKYSGESPLTVPQKEGLEFKGWYLDQNQTQVITSFAGLSGDVVLYGRWVGIIYTVKIEGIEGAALAAGSVTVTGFTTDDTTLSLPAYTKSFYTFEGLYLDSSYSGTAITQINKNSVETGTTLILYAKWEQKPCEAKKVIPFGKGDSFYIWPSKPFMDLTDVSRYLDTEGCAFDGWYWNYENGVYTNKVTSISLDDFTEEQNVRNIYGKYIRKTTLSPNGATARATSMKSIEADIAELTANEEFYLIIDEKTIESSDLSKISASLKANKTAKFYLDFAKVNTSFVLEDASQESNGSFYGCKNLSGIKLPNKTDETSYVSIPAFTFEGCESLAEIPNELKVIGNRAFKNCVNLESVLFSSYIKIGEEAFMGCNKLSNVKIPKDVTQIYESCFKDCLNLNKVYYDSTLSDLQKQRLNFEGPSSKPMPFGNEFYVLNDSKTSWERVYAVNYENARGFESLPRQGIAFRRESDAFTLAHSEILGYQFVAWYETEDCIGSPITTISSGTKKDFIVFAKWSPNTDTQYTVNHYKEKVDGGYYWFEDDILRGTTGELTKGVPKNYDHYVVVEPIEQLIINPNPMDNNRLRIYYNLEKIKFTLNLDGGSLDDETDIVSRIGKYGENVNISNPKKTGAIFAGWNTVGGTLPDVYETDGTYKAIWVSGNPIEVIVNPISDISVTKAQSSQNISFTAEQCDSYSWMLDGVSKGSSQICSINTLTLSKGTYTLTLEAKKGGKWYSYTAQIKIN